MTKGKAGPVIVVAAIFDLFQIFFVFFWFLGPALASLYCTAKVSSWVGSLWGLVPAACTGVAAVGGSAATAVTVPIGVVMAFAVGLFGWATIILWIALTNSRVFKEDKGAIVRIIIGLIIDEAPLIGALPALSYTTWRLYHTQIKMDKAKLKRYQAEQKADEERERQEQALQYMQYRALKEAQMQEMEAANDAQYKQDEIPEEGRRAA